MTLSLCCLLYYLIVYLGIIFLRNLEVQFLHLCELELIKYLQLFRTPFLDKFFIFLNFFDTPYFFLILVPIIWLVKGWKWGIRILYLIIIASFFCTCIKNIFCFRRPFNLDPTVAIITVKESGFPSGGAEKAVIFATLLIKYLKNKKWGWILGLNLIFWIGLSRIYLGVHFISDVFGGYILGLIIVLLFFYFSLKIESYLSKRSLSWLFFLNAAFAAFIACFDVFIGKMTGMSIFIIGSGSLISQKFNLLLPPSKSITESFAKIGLFFVGAFLLFLPLCPLLSILSKKGVLVLGAFVLGVWISILIGLIWKKVFLKLKIFKR
jgi:membrane-associated phospholipid phosphatase